jgi:hypothetical protein
MGTQLRKMRLLEAGKPVCHRAPRHGLKRTIYWWFLHTRHHLNNALQRFEMRVLCDRWCELDR